MIWRPCTLVNIDLPQNLHLERRKYVYKAGESEPRGEDGCSITEATQALACAHSVGLAVQVKREIGEIWRDTESAPFTEIFSDNLNSGRVWRYVVWMRAVDDELGVLRKTEAARADMVGVHMIELVVELGVSGSSSSPDEK